MTDGMQDAVPDGRLARLIARQAEKRHLAAVWAEAAGLAPAMVVLDIGAGTGALTLEYACIVGPDGCAIALDPDGPCVAHAQAEAVRRGLRLCTLVGAIEALPALPAAPDHVMLTDALHHMDDPGAALRAIRTAMPRHATLFIAEYDPEAPGAVGAPLAMRLPRARVRTLLDQAGFTAIRDADAPDEHYIVLARAT